jgi:4-alpha-glucanotransferase
VTDPIDTLTELYGVGATYRDFRNEEREIPLASRTAILATMGVDASTPDAITRSIRAFERERFRYTLPPVIVARAGAQIEVPIVVPARSRGDTQWMAGLESGETRSGTERLDSLAAIEHAVIDGLQFDRLKLTLPADLPLGYHTLMIAIEGQATASTRLIVTPAQSYGPPALADDKRIWGIAVQLYSLRSMANWGVGDFGDLRELIHLAAPLGCGIIGLNPLHALMPANPAHISPYSPSSRQFLNVIYIAVPEVLEFASCKPAQRRVSSPEFQVQLTALRATPNVDYVRVAHLKFEVLRLLYAQFRALHLASDTPRARAFREYVATFGEPLRLHAIYDALDAHFRKLDRGFWGWPNWPGEYRDPTSAAVARFAHEHEHEVEYFLYLQWLAETQLSAAQKSARDAGMAIGLYGDVAVGANPGGSETWANRKLYLEGASVGAPPDALALKGQDWGIPPQSPVELTTQAYAPFITLIRNNMRPVAALRFDHVMTLYRLWLVPQGMISTNGAYAHYPVDDLIAILALESHRNSSLVIGEDLGTVPEAMTHAMEQYHIYHYKVLLFEQLDDGTFKLPSVYVRNALATVTTHDLPTLRGWWESRDVDLRDRLNLYPSAEVRDIVHANRGTERVQMMRALTAQDLWHWRENDPLPEYSPALARAIHAYLGLSTAGIALVQVEDLIGMTDPVNVPGTDREHANWQRKVALATADIFARSDVIDILQAMNRARQGENPNG